MSSFFDLDGHTVFVTGAGGLLGQYHCRASVEAGARVVAIDKQRSGLDALHDEFPNGCITPVIADITDETMIRAALASTLSDSGRKYGLVNNAAVNSKVESDQSNFVRLEDFDIDQWNSEIAVGLTGAMIMTKIIGSTMAHLGEGSIVNISSDHGLIAPDQRLYGGADSSKVKPVTYSVVKHGIIGLTRYTSTYWAHRGVRANALCPGGVANHQPEEFVSRFGDRVPLGRMANQDEFSGSLIFLLSAASSYMTGGVLVVDGGRSVW